MNIIANFLIAISLAAPAAAEQRAPQLPPIDAGSVWNQINNQHNNLPQPAPVTLDTCVFTEFRNNKCYFKCQSGAILKEPAMRPDFSAGEPAGACATHIIRTIPAGPLGKAAAGRQTFNSFGSYSTRQEAALAMEQTLNGLNYAKAKITGSKLVTKGPNDYDFQITFLSRRSLIVYPGVSFRREADAYNQMFDRVERLENEGNDVAFTELVRSGPTDYSYVVGYFVSEEEPSRRSVKARACIFSKLENDTCMYKCTGGSAYSRPALPAAEFQAPCTPILFQI
ncbi:MAG TPA: hypothetical protein DCS63_09960 [Elusimicrobia bacterium]|nr:hypothetical protein [Elusimicrobiota bacterium]